MIPIILGSSSPRRKTILSIFTENFQVISPETDESPFENEIPEIYAMRVASDKCDEVGRRCAHDERIIITSDTTVALGNVILGKPSDRNDAFATLKLLSGKRHRVISSLCVDCKSKAGSKRQCRTGITIVTFKNLSDFEINGYLDVTDYADKAGSYAIQENGNMIIENCEGSHSAVVGFPSGTFLEMVADMNLSDELWNLNIY